MTVREEEGVRGEVWESGQVKGRTTAAGDAILGGIKDPRARREAVAYIVVSGVDIRRCVRSRTEARMAVVVSDCFLAVARGRRPGTNGQRRAHAGAPPGMTCFSPVGSCSVATTAME